MPPFRASVDGPRGVRIKLKVLVCIFLEFGMLEFYEISIHNTFVKYRFIIIIVLQ